MNDVKRVVLSSICSDTDLARRLVLKGGSALDIAYGLSSRLSMDIDLSIEGDFDPSELTSMNSRLQELLEHGFRVYGLSPIDLKFDRVPDPISEDLAGFWGGYCTTFKLVPAALKKEGLALRDLRIRAFRPSERASATFQIDISRHECCSELESIDVLGHHLFVYSPRLILCEKLRALCQQMPEYLMSVKRPHNSARSRDLFDIRELVVRANVSVASAEFWSLCLQVFVAKHVPMSLLWRLEEAREIHRADFESLKDAISDQTLLLSYDDYFDFVLQLVDSLKAFGNVEPPA